MRALQVPIGICIACAVAVAALLVASNRPTFLASTPAATTTSTPAILTSGTATVSRKPDLAILAAGVESDGSTASAAQTDLASKAAKLVARVKSLGVPDNEINTTGCWIGPVYAPGEQRVTAFRATEQLHIKWHNVDSVGKALDAIVQEGGATNISIGFVLADPRPAQAEARSNAIAEARSKAGAMASAAGVHLGQVLRISDVTVSSRPLSYDLAGAAAAPTQVPVGELDVQVTVEVDFAIA